MSPALPLPLDIELIRHAESMYNAHPELCKHIPDHAIPLTETGIAQAKAAGAFLAKHLSEKQERENAAYCTHWSDPSVQPFGKVRVWFSSYFRARMTARYIIYQLHEALNPPGTDPEDSIVSMSENPFLTEQDLGLRANMTVEEYECKFPHEAAQYKKFSEYNGAVYSRPPLGESRMDMAIRCKPFFATIHKDIDNHDIRNVVIVCHGTILRVLTGTWLHYLPEWLNAEKNPGNCWVRQIHGLRGKNYVDEGYIYGEGACLRNPMATQLRMPNAEKSYVLKPMASNAIIPPGINPIDAYSRPENDPPLREVWQTGAQGRKVDDHLAP